MVKARSFVYDILGMVTTAELIYDYSSTNGYISIIEIPVSARYAEGPLFRARPSRAVDPSYRRLRDCDRSLP